jgi:hypothetical protein
MRATSALLTSCCESLQRLVWAPIPSRSAAQSEYMAYAIPSKSKQEDTHFRIHHKGAARILNELAARESLAAELLLRKCGRRNYPMLTTSGNAFMPSA